MDKRHGNDETRRRTDLTLLLVFVLVLTVYFLYQATFINGIKRLF